MKCSVCQNNSSQQLYESHSPYAVTSLGQVYKAEVHISVCNICSHIQTKPLENIQDYYEKFYNILIGSDEEDQLYVEENGTTHYRLQYQADLLLNKITLKGSEKILDFGCAKAATMKKICEKIPTLKPYCFDLSDIYQTFWKTFVPTENTYVGQVAPKEWNEHFDIITSFFSLEHAEDPIAFIQDIKRLLKKGGMFFCVVPNVFANWADLIVVDHVHHFTELSIEKLFYDAGFSIHTIDDKSYHGAFVITAVNESPSNLFHLMPKSTLEEIYDIANYWKNIQSKIDLMLDKDEPFAIYGSGFYGTYIASHLHKEPVCFIDQNPYRQGQTLFEKPIISPDKIPDNINHILVGLNPKNAHQIINKTFCSSAYKFSYL